MSDPRSIKNIADKSKRNPNTIDLSSYTFGKLPPQAVELEEAVLGACLVEQNAVALAIDLIKPEYFYVPNYQTIFEAITQLFKKNDPIDILTVSEKLKDLGKLEQVGGIYELSILTNKIASTANTEAHCYIIIEKYIARALINYSSDSIKAAYDDSNDIFELIDDLSVKLLALRQNTVKNKPVHIEQVANENMSEIKQKAKSDKKQIGVQSGIKAIDEIIGGFLPQLYIVAGRPGSGKCLAKGTKVLMYDGTIKNVEDIKNGELVMGDNSTERIVSGTISGQEEMFEIIPTKGERFTVNRSHVLSLRMSSSNGKVYHKDQIINISVDDYLKQNDKFKHHAKLWRTAVEFKEQEVPISPYLYGLWLGDGAKRDPRITNCDTEVESYLKTIATKVYTDKRTGARTYNLFGQPKLKKIITESVVNNKKTILKNYLINSRKNRLELLAGLIDTDGYLSSNCLEIVTKYDTLRDDILFLCRSLGLAAYSADKIGTIKTSGFKGDYYRITISGNIDIIPCRIKRRQATERKQIKNALNVGFKIESKGIGEYYGFEVDKNNLFLLGDFTVTHNTSLVTSCLKNIAVDNLIPCGVFSLEMTKEQVELRLKTIKTGISNIRLIKGDVKGENEWEQLYEATEEIAGSPIFIDDSSAINIVDLRSKIINLIAKFDIKIVFIDYIQRMQSAEKGQKDLRLITNEVTNGLARIAKDLKIPVVALSQLSRSVESTKDKMPELHHLKESGNIEEDAYCVMFIYRPEYYGLPTFANEHLDISSTDKAQVLIAKHRNGSLGEPIISFIKSKMLFEDLSSYQPITQDLQAKINEMGKIKAKGKEEDFNDF